MKERPILFSGEMVKAILAGQKTQTRRPCKPVRRFEHHNICKPEMAADAWAIWWHGAETDRVGCLQTCPYGVPGDRLWVREAWRARLDQDALAPRDLPHRSVWYCATGNGHGDEEPSGCAGGVGKKRPGMFLPRWASRITLELTDVRVQRIQEIKDADITAEGVGVPENSGNSLKDWFAYRWDRIYSESAPWSSNPWVWALTFRRACPETALLKVC